MGKNTNNGKKMLFEMMHKVGGMPLKENTDIYGDEMDYSTNKDSIKIPHPEDDYREYSEDDYLEYSEDDENKFLEKNIYDKIVSILPDNLEAVNYKVNPNTNYSNRFVRFSIKLVDYNEDDEVNTFNNLINLLKNNLDSKIFKKLNIVNRTDDATLADIEYMF